jgi:regulator of sigma E protease
MLTAIAFLVALGLLIAVHEYGHYRMAVACGVKVLRFSIGFGKTVIRWRRPGSPTEFAIGLLPLGGYVKMLDEREGPVDPEERHRAFNNRPLRQRAAIVAAGPAANLLLAVLLYTVVSWSGVQEPEPLLAAPVPGSIAAQTGHLQGGERVLRAGFVEEDLQEVRSFETLHWLLTRGALDNRDVRIDYLPAGAPTNAAARSVVLHLAGLDVRNADAALLRTVGLIAPWTRPVIGNIVPGGAAESAGLREGDLVLDIDGKKISDGQALREAIRANVKSQNITAAPAAHTQSWRIERSGHVLSLSVTPRLEDERGLLVGRIGAYVGAPPAMTTVRHGPIDGLREGAARTWEVSILTLRMMGRMVIGEASLKNISGPLTIADYAGKSARLGFVQYLTFLALISVSLGVLNLLPLPVLDGGHLMYYLWEALTGKGVSDAWMERLQRGGIAVLLLMMSVAFFNDVTRIFG